jgi:hypothetical protein
MTTIKTVVALWIAVAVLAACASSPDHGQAPDSFDTDGDGYLTPEEYSASRLSEVLKFEELDTDADGLLSDAELAFGGVGGASQKLGKRGEGRKGTGGRSRT